MKDEQKLLMADAVKYGMSVEIGGKRVHPSVMMPKHLLDKFAKDMKNNKGTYGEYQQQPQNMTDEQAKDDCERLKNFGEEGWAFELPLKHMNKIRQLIAAARREGIREAIETVKSEYLIMMETSEAEGLDVAAQLIEELLKPN